MSDDICDRLMRFAGKVCLSTDTEVEAADEIERLRAENEKLRAENETHKEIAVRETMNVATLRAALKPFADLEPEDTDCDGNGEVIINCDDLRVARAAIGETGDD